MTPNFALDHIVVSAKTLAEGTERVEDLFGVQLSAVGVHGKMGTHNRLLSLGAEIYLEVIAIDPQAAPPPHPRWFDLDNFDGPPRVTNWVCRTDNLKTALDAAPAGLGRPMALQRGDYRWQFAVPEDGRLPFDGAAPALIQWDSAVHPAPALEDAGIRLRSLDIEHPAADSLKAEFPALAGLDAVRIDRGPRISFTATFDTPHGKKVLT